MPDTATIASNLPGQPADAATTRSLSNVLLPLPALPSDNKPITDLSIYSQPQLVELRDRQQHLLANKKRLAGLPDKGARIQELRDRILAALRNSDAVHQASELFSVLNIAETGRTVTAQMEWHGRTTELGGSDDGVTAADAFSDERDPLKLLAQSRDLVKLVQIEPPTETLITDADRLDIAELQNESNSNGESSDEPLEPHAKYMCSIDNRHLGTKAKFLPHKTIIAAVKSPKRDAELDKISGNRIKWENTSATPPQLRNPEVVVLSLSDSIEIQRVQQKAMKILEEKLATERLVARNKLAAKVAEETHKGEAPVDHLAPSFAAYRSKSTADEDDDEDDDSEADAALYDDEDGVASDGDGERQS